MLNQKVLSLHRQGRCDPAVVVAKKALQVAEETFRPDHPDVAMSLTELALLYTLEGQHERAEPLLKGPLAIWQTASRPAPSPGHNQP